MPLNITPKASSANSNTPSRVIDRSQVQIGRQPQSTARVEALKARLKGQTPAQPAAPRPARTTARAEEFAKLQKFTQTTQITSKGQSPTPRTTARSEEVDFSKIAPPPSGLAEGSVAQPPTHTGASTKPTTEATSEVENPQFVALARRERQLRKAQQEFKTAQDAWKQEQAKYLPKERLTSETLKVLAEAGITPDKLVELQINQAASEDPNQALRNELAQLKKQLNDITDPENGTLAKRDQEAYDAAVSQIRNDAKLLVDSNPSYELTKSEGQTEEVVNLITAVFEQEGLILDVEEAAQLVEDKLSERIAKQFEKISKYDKIKKKFGKPAEEQAEANTEQRPQISRVNTLTNAGSAMNQLSPRDRAVLIVQARLDAAKGK